MIPKPNAFNLLGGTSTSNSNKESKQNNKIEKKVSHIRTKIFLSILTDNISFSENDVPPELRRFVRANKNYQFLPILQNDFLKSRLNDFDELNRNLTKLNLEINYTPMGTGKLRLILHVEHAMSSLYQLGFTEKDVDEVKGIFSDTNVYLLCGTMFVGSIHVSLT